MSSLKKLRKLLGQRFGEAVHIKPDPISNLVTLCLYIPSSPHERRMPIEWLDEKMLFGFVRIKVAKKRKKCSAWEASIFFKDTEETKTFPKDGPVEDIIEWLYIRYCVFKFEA